MHRLRHAHTLARLVLVWFVLSLGVAIATPLVKPQAMQLVCTSASSIKLVAIGTDGKASSPQSPTLDCPLCAGIAAPPPAVPDVFAASAPHGVVQPLRDPSRLDAALVLPPPARGPPARA